VDDLFEGPGVLAGGQQVRPGGPGHPATVRAAGEIHVVEIDATALAALLESRPELAEELERRMAARLEDLGQARRRGDSVGLPGGLLNQLRLRLRRLVGGWESGGNAES